jgi:hypothetical protein
MMGLNLVHSSKCEEKSVSEQDLIFEEICPVWAEKFRKGMDKLDKYILATDSKYCLVGEAWGFTGKQTGYYVALLILLFGCWTCVKYGQKFGRMAKEYSTVNDFESLISEFLSDWNQEHKSITKKMKPKLYAE